MSFVTGMVLTIKTTEYTLRPLYALLVLTAFFIDDHTVRHLIIVPGIFHSRDSRKVFV